MNTLLVCRRVELGKKLDLFGNFGKNQEVRQTTEDFDPFGYYFQKSSDEILR